MALEDFLGAWKVHLKSDVEGEHTESLCLYRDIVNRRESPNPYLEEGEKVTIHYNSFSSHYPSFQDGRYKPEWEDSGAESIVAISRRGKTVFTLTPEKSLRVEARFTEEWVSDGDLS